LKASADDIHTLVSACERRLIFDMAEDLSRSLFGDRGSDPAESAIG
jgi:hypothetical protein